MTILTDYETICLHQSAIRAYETLLSVDAHNAARFARRFGICSGRESGCYDLNEFFPYAYLAALTALTAEEAE